ncbi:ABC transporter ATP-binding protein [Lactobacillus corticis]|uniref:Antimicrobial peptide ABC transporter ATP-binding protein n=1 Tax=Lactobacillus corticis TaxID=2201249 RepID=A0A916QFQ5_9LACO|nr:ABC transporter ATP-binding protein [Lactobacillus corticis]GFZ26464.1 antimicrobial peptide ABC transporter ATP-binding protein [Lactobacillus corticis]
MSVVTIEKLGKKYKRTILEDVAFSLEAGTMTALIGASGEGKTTILNIIGLLDSDYTGQVLLFDTNVADLSEKEQAHYRNTKLGFILQEPLLIDRMTVRENILLPTVYLSKKERENVDFQTRLVNLTKNLGIYDLLDEKPNTLSGGQKQRVVAARALINDPELILADEPTGALDQDNANIILQLFKKLIANGKTVLTVTHDSNVAKQHDRILKLANSHVLEIGEEK